MAEAKALIIPATPKCADGLKFFTKRHEVGPIDTKGVVVESQKEAITPTTLMDAFCATCGEQLEAGCDHAPIRNRYFRKVTVGDEKNHEGFTEVEYF